MYFVFQEARGCLEKTIYWLEQEPEVLPEGQLLIQAKLNISEMEKTLESVHRLTSSIPAMWGGRTPPSCCQRVSLDCIHFIHNHTKHLLFSTVSNHNEKIITSDENKIPLTCILRLFSNLPYYTCFPFISSFILKYFF